MDLRYLRYFVAVAEELHFSRAADRIGIEPSPLSRAIRALEADLGTALFVRTSRRTRLTPAGQRLLPEAQRILVEVQRACVNARIANAVRRERLNIGLADSIAHPRLSRALASTADQEPELELSLIHVPVAQQVQKLDAGAIDIAISPIAARLERLRSEALCTVPLVAVIPARHRAAMADRLTLADVLGEGCVVCHPEVRRACGALGDITGIDAVHSLSMLLEMVAGGFAVGLAPRTQLEATRRPDIVTVPFDDRHLKITIYAIRCNSPPSGACSRFIERARLHATGK